MIAAHHIRLIRTAESVVLDTNVALLYVIGSHNPGLVERWSRTDMFAASDFALLTEAIGLARSVVTTPHVLTEASHFLGTTRRPWLRRCFGGFPETHPAFATMESATELRRFQRLGLTDWALSRLAAQRVLVLTVDLDLCIEIESIGLDVLNFNHLRDPG